MSSTTVCGWLRRARRIAEPLQARAYTVLVRFNPDACHVFIFCPSLIGTG
ncbi:hypothetical protein AB0K16_60150 [Nonomuraea jabiensis]